MSDRSEFHIDRRLARSAFEHAAASYDGAAVLQREVAGRLLERLDLVKIQPRSILDVGCGTGFCTVALGRRYPGARVVGLDIALPMLQRARAGLPWWRRWRGRDGFVGGDAQALPLADASVDLLVSNLTLQWCTDADAVFREFRRVLVPGGLALFSTFGPDTLKELRAAWAQVDARTHVNAFLDMHDLGDAMVRAGLAHPVMDMENITLTYADVRGLARDLKHIGAHNVTQGRSRALTGKGRFAAMVQAYEAWRREGVLPATYEVVYGHAWGAEPAARQAGTATFGVEALRATARGRREER